MRVSYQLHPIGWIHKTDNDVRIDLEAKYQDGMVGLEGFSHIIVCYWFHENDNPQDRSRLQVRPRRNPANPLTGVFATHAPVRPNLVALSTCRVESIDGARIYIDAIDARNGSPVVDIKCYIPHKVDPAEVSVPDWVLEQAG